MRKVNETLGYKADDNYTDFDAWKADAKAKGYRIEKDAPHTYSAIDAQGVDVGSFHGTGYFAESIELSRIKQLAGINNQQYIAESTPAFVATQLDDGTIFTNESMADILEKLKHVVTDSTKIDEWANSIESRTNDHGRVMELPAGEIIDNSLRRYLDAIPQKVTVVENQDISEAEMFSNYKKFAESADEIDEANDDFEERPVYTNTETGKQTRYIPKDINTPPTRPKPRPNAPLVSPRPKPRPNAPLVSPRPNPRP